jgi:hypothetical protein
MKRSGAKRATSTPPLLFGWRITLLLLGHKGSANFLSGSKKWSPTIKKWSPTMGEIASTLIDCRSPKRSAGRSLGTLKDRRVGIFSAIDYFIVSHNVHNLPVGGLLRKNDTDNEGHNPLKMHHHILGTIIEIFSTTIIFLGKQMCLCRRNALKCTECTERGLKPLR